MTFSNDARFVAPVVDMMMGSREAAVDYMTPLGLHHLMARGHHYGPGPWVAGGPRADWTSVYYHRADHDGIGFDRSASGSNAVAQYAPPLAREFGDVAHACRSSSCCGSTMCPGTTARVPDARCGTNSCIATPRASTSVRAMRETWSGLGEYIDPERHAQVAAFLAIQEKEAQWWRDASIAYFQTFSGRPLPQGYAPPAHHARLLPIARLPLCAGAVTSMKPMQLRVVPSRVLAVALRRLSRRQARRSRGDAPLLHAMFQDHAVLQRDQPIRVWGHAQPGETVKIEFAGKRRMRSADANGRWEARLPAAASRRSVHAHREQCRRRHADDQRRAGRRRLAVLGAVEHGAAVWRTLDARAEIAGASSDRIRLLTVPQDWQARRRRSTFAGPVQWRTTTSDTRARLLRGLLLLRARIAEDRRRADGTDQRRLGRLAHPGLDQQSSASRDGSCTTTNSTCWRCTRTIRSPRPAAGARSGAVGGSGRTGVAPGDEPWSADYARRQ